MPARSPQPAKQAPSARSAPPAKAAGGPAAAEDIPINRVHLRGRISGSPVRRALPSGDQVIVFRLVVPRAGPGPSVDTIDCAVWKSGLRRRVGGWANGDQIEVTGALHRRFWRAGAAVASRCEVEVATARRRTRASRA